MMDLIWADLDNLKTVPGNFDRIEIKPNGIELEGWILSSVPFEQLSVFFNGQLTGEAEGVNREDVGRAHPWIGHARSSGFRFAGETGSVRPVNTVQLIGADSSGPIACLATLSFLEKEPPESFPPVRLAKMIGAPDRAAYEQQGAKVLADLMLVMDASGSMKRFETVLDWGCGCGRLTRLLIQNFETMTVFGCDIVADLIAWCRKTLPGAEFRLHSTAPPTPYPDDTFDLVVGVSVMTHLNRRLQLDWLAEVSRILKPGGTFLVSTLGEYALIRHHYNQGWIWRFVWRRSHESKLARLRERGILDSQSNRSLRRVTPAGYYRDVYQTEAYTRRHWTRYFEILDYIPSGMGAFQDLWRMRAR